MLRVGPNTSVKMECSLSLDSGMVIESSQEKEPVQFRYGSGKILPKLEEELVGLFMGEEKEVTLSPSEAYGEINPKLIQIIPISVFPRDAEIKVGQVFQMVDNDGKSRLYYVRKIEGDHVTVDFNHPLAGRILHFHIVIRDVQNIL